MGHFHEAKAMGKLRSMLAAIAGLLSCLMASAAQGEESANLADLIDRQIHARLNAERLVRVPRADDSEFLRRVSLDLRGVVPSAEQTKTFLDSRDSNKRTELIQKLLASPRLASISATRGGAI